MKKGIVKYGARPRKPQKDGEPSKFRDFVMWLLPWVKEKGYRADKAANARLEREIEETEKIKAERLKLEAETRKIHIETTSLAIEKEIELRKEFNTLMKEESEIRRYQKGASKNVRGEIILEKVEELDKRREDLIKLLHLYGGEIRILKEEIPSPKELKEKNS